VADFPARFQPASDQSLLVSFADRIDRVASLRVRRLLRLLELNPVQGVVNLHPAYCSIVIRFDALVTEHRELEALVRPLLENLDAVALPGPREVEIPVCYGGEFGVDLADVADLHGMTPAQVAARHSSANYTVDFLGFAPGFGYLSGLPDELATPRLPVPRRSVPAGSVGIAGNQTGVYPFATAGGWRLIGRTPVAMFRPDRQPMSLLSIGDRVRFRPISAEEFAR
jgi:inhibitor of KinA